MLNEEDQLSDSNDESQQISRDRLALLHGTTYLTENESGFFNESTANRTKDVSALEQEYEELNSSLMALTSHFARVQFRLKQVVDAPTEEKDKMLEELEQFAFRGCPNLSNPILLEGMSHEKIIAEQHMKQKELIEQLRSQLQDLESYTYEPGQSDLPSNVVLEKQKVIIDELKDKIDFDDSGMDKLSNEELKKAVENAINQISNPAKVKDQLVTQLKTQISDLERFIQFLQGEATSPGPYGKYGMDSSAFPIFNQPTSAQSSGSDGGSQKNKDTESQSSIALLKRMLSIMQIFAITQFGCSNGAFEKNVLKKQSTSHWGDMRANLEISISKVLKLYGNLIAARQKNKLKFNSTHTTESDEEQNQIEEPPNDLIRTVRKELACCLRDLMQHGLIEVKRGTSLVPFGCFVVRSKESPNQMHVWELFLKYFDIKHGKEYTQSAANKLSQSFNLNIVSGKPITIKQSLLNAIEQVQKVHNYDNSNQDSCFKAFICLALNEKKLVLYLKQLLKTTVIIENYYQTWSYVKTTGFDDALKSLDQLKIVNTNFPVEKSARRKSLRDKEFI